VIFYEIFFLHHDSNKKLRKFAIQRYVDIPSHLTYVATLPCETMNDRKTNKIHRVPKHQADAFLSTWQNVDESR